MIERRSILKCLVGLVAAPAIIKIAGIMPVKASLQPSDGWAYNPVMKLWSKTSDYYSLDDYSEHILAPRIAQWENSPGFVQRVNQAYDEQFGAGGAKIGDAVRIRLPNDYTVMDGPGISVQDAAPRYLTVSRGNVERDLGIIPDKLALAAAAVAIAPTVLKTPVTRRFWAA